MNLWTGPNTYLCVAVAVGCAAMGVIALFGRRQDTYRALLVFGSGQFLTGLIAVFRKEPLLVFGPALGLGAVGLALWLTSRERCRRVAWVCVGFVLSWRFPCVCVVLASPPVALWWIERVENDIPLQSRAMKAQLASAAVAEGDSCLSVRMDDDRTLSLVPGLVTTLTEAQQKVHEAAFFARHDLVGRVLRLGPAQPGCNCHGWVFTGGRYVLGSSDVEMILQGNGYSEVRVPRPGDLVIYRDSAGVLMHSGVVQSRIGDRVLVESVWVNLGRYLHPVEAYSFYKARWTYYRSLRPGHLLQGIEPDDHASRALLAN